MPTTYPAPWSTSLKVLSAIGTAVVLGVGVLLLTRPDLPPLLRLLLPLGLLLLLAACALFTVRHYRLDPDTLWVQRLCWQTVVPLRHLQEVEVRPLHQDFTLRVCGNGGLFSFSGLYWNRSLGRFRLFGTDLHRAVVLRFDRRRVVVTPDDPAAFAAHLRQLRQVPDSPALS